MSARESISARELYATGAGEGIAARVGVGAGICAEIGEGFNTVAGSKGH